MHLWEIQEASLCLWSYFQCYLVISQFNAFVNGCIIHTSSIIGVCFCSQYICHQQPKILHSCCSISDTFASGCEIYWMWQDFCSGHETPLTATRLSVSHCLRICDHGSSYWMWLDWWPGLKAAHGFLRVPKEPLTAHTEWWSTWKMLGFSTSSLRNLQKPEDKWHVCPQPVMPILKAPFLSLHVGGHHRTCCLEPVSRMLKI